MIPAYTKIPYAIPFSFASVDDDNRLQAEVLVPYDVAVYAITMTNNFNPQSFYYHANINFLNYHSGSLLFDEPLSNLCFQADARTPWRLPSHWWIRKNEKIVCTLNSFDNVVASTYYITLLGYVCDIDPNPGMQPFVYSFPISVGFQDNVGGATSVTFGQVLTGTMAKHMLHDFEIHSIALDPWGTTTSDNVPQMSFQLSTQKRKIYDRMIIDGVAGGGSTFSQGDTIPLLPALGQNVHGWPEDAILQWYLPQKERVNKGELVRIDISPAPTYLSSDDIHAILNQLCCMAVIGNHLG